MMKKLVLAVAALAVFAAPSFAQQVKWVDKELMFLRRGNPAVAFPNGAVGTAVLGAMANGGKGGTGVAVSPQDTSLAIFVGDHASRLSSVYRANVEALNDTSAIFGVLRIRSTVGTIDTIKVIRDVSLDGNAWTVVDSASAGGILSTSGTIAVQPIAGDSCSVILSSVTGSVAGETFGAGGIMFLGNPNEQVTRRTRQAMLGFNYVRFRVIMTPGDNVAAGASGGISAVFSYPAVASGPLQ